MFDTVLRDPFRVLFICAGLSAAALLPVWLLLMAGGLPLTPVVHPVRWHAHEMLFGFGGALIAGFVLTAARNWTGLPTAGPRLIGLLVVLWLAVRMLLWLPGSGSAPAAALAGAAFFVLAGIAVGRPVVRAGSYRNLIFIPLFVWLGGLQVLALTGSGSVAAVALELGLYTIVALLVFMGGRVIPFFTQRRLPEAGVIRRGWLDHLTNLAAVLLIPAVLLEDSPLRGVLLAVAGLAVLLRLADWAPWATWRVPLLWVLHLGYLWLAVGLLFAAVGVVSGVWPASDASHALSIGALGTLAMGMMSRVSLGHSGHALEVGRLTPWLFAVPAVAAVVRLLAPYGVPLEWFTAMVVAGVLWTLAWLLWVALYMPVWCRPVTPR